MVVEEAMVLGVAMVGMVAGEEGGSITVAQSPKGTSFLCLAYQ